MDFKQLINDITREHPDWTAEQIKAELYHRVIESSAAFLNDAHVFFEEHANIPQER